MVVIIEELVSFVFKDIFLGDIDSIMMRTTVETKAVLITGSYENSKPLDILFFPWKVLGYLQLT